MPIDIIALLTPSPGKADRVEELLRQAAADVKANEPGTLRYHLQRETKGDSPTFIMLETYRDMAAIQTHSKSEASKTLGRIMKKEGLLAAPMKVIFTKEVAGFASKL
ncbi:hypothetical protein GQ44DRAFT_689958 [Phaeosphaeriaceae sp. PMI808]|nr:hypothetical protein GQ44DRAFT_689958 [Phaeosphaeriaceae sp. PMI808]